MATTKKNGDTLTIAGRKYTIHPTAGMIPAMRDDEYEKLKADIAENGVRQRILVKGGTIILDGIHRARAVAELEKEGVKKTLPTEPFSGSEEKINSEIVSRNVHRRHLNDDQRLTLLAWAIVPQLKEDAAKRKEKGEKDVTDKESGEAAEILATKAEAGQTKSRKAIDIVTHLPESEVKKIITGKSKFGDAAREARKRKLKASGKTTKPRKAPKPVDKLAPEYIHKRFGMFLKHWTHSQHRKVRDILSRYIK